MENSLEQESSVVCVEGDENNIPVSKSWELLCFTDISLAKACANFIQQEKTFISQELLSVRHIGIQDQIAHHSDENHTASISFSTVLSEAFPPSQSVDCDSDCLLNTNNFNVQPHNSLVLSKAVDKILTDAPNDTKHVLNGTAQILAECQSSAEVAGSPKQPIGFYININNLKNDENPKVSSDNVNDKKIFSMFVSLDESNAEVDVKKSPFLRRSTATKPTVVKEVMEVLQQRIQKQKKLLTTVITEDSKEASSSKNFVSLSDIHKISQNSITDLFDQPCDSLHNIQSRLIKSETSTSNDILSSFSSESVCSLNRLFPQLREMSDVYHDYEENLPCSINFANDLLRMLEEEIVPDVTLIVEGRQVKAHRIVLESRSPYFADLLRKNADDNFSNIVIVQGFSYKVMHCMLKYIYCGIAKWPDSINIWELVRATCMLGLEPFKDEIEVHLRRDICHDFHEPCSVCINGVLKTISLAEVYGMDNIYNTSLTWITTYFEITWPTGNFTKLSVRLMDACCNKVINSIEVNNALSMIMKSKSVLETIHTLRLYTQTDKVIIRCKRILAIATKLASRYLVDTLRVVLSEIKQSQSKQTQMLCAIHYCITEGIKSTDRQKLTQVYWLMDDIKLFSHEDMEFIDKCKFALLSAINSNGRNVSNCSLTYDFGLPCQLSSESYPSTCKGKAPSTSNKLGLTSRSQIDSRHSNASQTTGKKTSTQNNRICRQASHTVTQTSVSSKKSPHSNNVTRPSRISPSSVHSSMNQSTPSMSKSRNNYNKSPGLRTQHNVKDSPLSQVVATTKKQYITAPTTSGGIRIITKSQTADLKISQKITKLSNVPNANETVENRARLDENHTNFNTLEVKCTSGSQTSTATGPSRIVRPLEGSYTKPSRIPRYVGDLKFSVKKQVLKRSSTFIVESRDSPREENSSTNGDNFG